MNKDKRLNGSFTVEAALLMNVYFALIIAMLMIMFIFHDRVVSQEIAYGHLIDYQSGEETESELYENLKKENKERLLVTEISSVQLTETVQKTEISYSSETNYIFSGILIKLMDSNLSETTSVSREKDVNMPLLLRSVQGLLKK